MYRFEGVLYGLVRCPCGFVYVDPRPDPDSIERMYDDPGYYLSGYTLGVETRGYFERKDELIAHYETVARDLARETGAPGDLLELGSAGGFFLEGARRAGFRVRGVEISPQAAESSRRDLGLDVHSGLLENAPFEPRTFDVAYADNVLEHTTSPEGVLRRLLDLLRPGGHLVVIVPTYVNSPYFRLMLLLQRLLPKRFLGEPLLKILKFVPDGDSGAPYHLLEFDRRTVVALLRRAGFEIVHVQASLPLPAHLFEVASPGLRVRILRGVFRALDFGMRAGILPGARTRVLARRPAVASRAA
jgi:SAM-dependent methyltransferase